MFPIMYGKPDKSKYARYFKEIFPNVYRVFIHEKGNDHSRFPIKLQQMESTTVLDVLCKRIHEKYPDLPIFTIHDCIVTLEGEESKVIDIIKEECTSRFGYYPQLKIEPWK